MNDQLQKFEPKQIQLPSHGEQIINQGRVYVLGEELGEGYFGKVFACKDRWANDLVAKVLLPQERSYEDVHELWLNELNNLVNLRHPNITYVYDAFEYRDTFYLVIERCGGDLLDLFRIPNFQGDLWLPAIARDILQALEFIHLAGYVHKDIHPGNLFILHSRDRMVPSKAPVLSFKVGDLGISRLESDINIFHTMLAQWMLPPEAINANEFGFVGRTVDIYHVGLVLLSVLLGRVPTFTQDEILAGKPRQIAESHTSPFAPAIAKALRRHTQYRPQSAAELWQLIVEAMPPALWPT